MLMNDIETFVKKKKYVNMVANDVKLFLKMKSQG